MIAIAAFVTCFFIDLPWWVCALIVLAAIKLEIAIEHMERA